MSLPLRRRSTPIASFSKPGSSCTEADNCFRQGMARRVRIDCTIEIAVEDLPPDTAGSTEELRVFGVRLSAITTRARTAVEIAPGVTLLMWTEMAGPVGDGAH